MIMFFTGRLDAHIWHPLSPCVLQNLLCSVWKMILMMDDIFLIAMESDINSFFFNHILPDVQFTLEMEFNNSSHFLGIFITRKSVDSMSIFLSLLILKIKKKTLTNQYLNLCSIGLVSHQRSAIRSLYLPQKNSL